MSRLTHQEMMQVSHVTVGGADGPMLTIANVSYNLGMSDAIEILEAAIQQLKALREANAQWPVLPVKELGV